MPRSRSSSSPRLLRSPSERNISATQVLPQSNFSPASRASTAWRTTCRFAPQVLQNLKSSLWLEPHFGQNIESPPSEDFTEGYAARVREVRWLPAEATPG